MLGPPETGIKLLGGVLIVFFVICTGWLVVAKLEGGLGLGKEGEGIAVEDMGTVRLLGAVRILGGGMLVVGCVAMNGRFLPVAVIFSGVLLMETEAGFVAGLGGAGRLVWLFKVCRLILADCKILMKYDIRTRHWVAKIMKCFDLEGRFKVSPTNQMKENGEEGGGGIISNAAPNLNFKDSSEHVFLIFRL